MDDLFITQFLDGLEGARDAEEFERLMLNDDSGDVWAELATSSARLTEQLDILQVTHALPWGEQPALDTLKGQRALERLQARYPEVWERVAVGQGDDASAAI